MFTQIQQILKPDMLTDIELILKNSFVYKIFSVFIIFDIYINFFEGTNLGDINQEWVVTKLNLSFIFIFIFILFIYFNLLIPFLLKIYYSFIFKFFSEQIGKYLEKKPGNSEKFVDIDFVRQYAIFNENSLLLKYAEEGKNILTTWYKDRENIFSLCIVGIYYIFTPYSSLNHDLLYSIQQQKCWPELIKLIILILMIYMIYNSTINIPTRKVYIANKKREEIKKFCLTNNFDDQG